MIPTIRQISAGQTLVREGEHCSSFALIVSGTLRVYKLGENGREVTLFRVGTGESCVLSATGILANNPFPAFATAETDIEAVFIEASEFRRLMDHSQAWRKYVFGLLAQRFSAVALLLESVAFERLDHRVANYLLRCSDPAGWIKATHQTIATEIGSSREVVSRVLKDFERQGFVRLQRGGLTVTDPQGLAGR